MINKFVALLAACAAFFGAIAVSFRHGKTLGAVEHERDELESVLDDIHQRDVIRDRVDNDSEYAKRVRDQFTR